MNVAKWITYFAFNPPVRHDRQMPNVLPLPMMFVQRLVMLASSARLSVPREKAVSVTAKVPATGAPWIVVPKAREPPAIGNAAEPATAALFEIGRAHV